MLDLTRDWKAESMMLTMGTQENFSEVTDVRRCVGFKYRAND
jgi:hypothetical protein